MKRIAVALLVAVAATASQSVSAADLAVAAAPASVPYSNWTGFYIGVHAGAAWQSAPNWSFTDPNLVVIPFNLSSSTGLGAVGGIQGGYNWQFASAWVVGIEGDISWVLLSDHRTNGPFSTIGGGPVSASSVSMSINTEWLSSVRGKLGSLAGIRCGMSRAVGLGQILNLRGPQWAARPPTRPLPRSTQRRAVGLLAAAQNGKRPQTSWFGQNTYITTLRMQASLRRRQSYRLLPQCHCP